MELFIFKYLTLVDFLRSKMSVRKTPSYIYMK